MSRACIVFIATVSEADAVLCLGSEADQTMQMAGGVGSSSAERARSGHGAGWARCSHTAGLSVEARGAETMVARPARAPL